MKHYVFPWEKEIEPIDPWTIRAQSMSNSRYQVPFSFHGIEFFFPVITIFFAIRLSKAKIPEWVDWVLVAYVVFHVVTHLFLTVRIRTLHTRKARRKWTVNLVTLKAHERRKEIIEASLKINLSSWYITRVENGKE